MKGKKRYCKCKHLIRSHKNYSNIYRRPNCKMLCLMPNCECKQFKDYGGETNGKNKSIEDKGW